MQRQVPSHVLRQRAERHRASVDYETSYFRNLLNQIREAESRERAEESKFRRAMLNEPAGYVESGRRLLEAIARRHGIIVKYEGHRKSDDGSCRGNLLLLPPPTNEDALATFAHELAHALNPCPGDAPHLAVIVDQTSRRCVMCEVEAWSKALELIPFTPAMGRSSEASLSTYRNTPMTPVGKTRSARYGAEWRIRLQQQVAREIRLEKFAEIRRWQREDQHA